MTRAKDISKIVTDANLSGTLDVTGEVNLSANLNLGDNDKAIFGAGSDLQIYHDGSNSIIGEVGTGNLQIRSGGEAMFLNEDGSEYIARFNDDSDVKLYHDNFLKLATTSTGINVTGTAVTDGLTVAGNVSIDGGTIKLDGNYPVGSENVALGNQALDDGSFSGNYNTAIGAGVLSLNTSGDENTAVGRTSLGNNTTGFSNTAIGLGTLFQNTTGTRNFAGGRNSLNANTTASFNTAVGHNTLALNTTGADNVAIGAYNLDANTTGSNNVAIGRDALTANTTADDNIAVGYQALYANTTGAANTAVGNYALDANTTGDTNTAIGYGSLGVCTEGFNNTALGMSSGFSVTTGDNNLLLGHDAGRTGSPGGNITTHNNNIILGDENITAFYAQVALTTSSDQRDKTDFTALDIGLDFVNRLTPYTYKWDKRSKYGDRYADDYDLTAQTPDGTHKEDWLDIGFKAQEVEALEVEQGYRKEDKTNLLITMTEDGKQYGMRYEKFVPVLVKAIQELSEKNDALEARIATLEGA